MSKTEWYRRTTWTPEDQADFEARLRRCRGDWSKSQNLSVQAFHLKEVGTPELIRAALGLLDRVIKEYPHERVGLAPALTQQAECLASLGRFEEALTAFVESLEQQRRFPNVTDDAYLSFGELVLKLARNDLFDDVLSAMDLFGQSEPFPDLKYRSTAIRALIAGERNDMDQAREWAQVALAAAAMTESGFSRHRKLGLVENVDPKNHEKLIKYSRQ